MEQNEQQIAILMSTDMDKAMPLLFNTYSAYLYAVCCRYISNDADASDVLQDSFIHVFRNGSKYQWRGKGSLLSWLTKIVVNLSLKHLEKEKKTQIVALDDSPDLENESPNLLHIPPEVLHTLIRKLPTGYRLVLNLYAFEGYSHKEIATQLGITPQTSASQLHHAKHLLKELIIEYIEKNK